MNDIKFTIKRIKIELISNITPSANVAQMVDALLNDKQAIDAKDMAWAQDRARALGFVPVGEVAR